MKIILEGKAKHSKSDRKELGKKKKQISGTRTFEGRVFCLCSNLMSNADIGKVRLVSKSGIQHCTCILFYELSSSADAGLNSSKLEFTSGGPAI